MQKYEILYEAQPRAFLKAVSAEEAAYLIRVIESYSEDPLHSGEPVKNPQPWEGRAVGQVYRIKTTRYAPGQRIFYYVLSEPRQMIVIKIANRDDDPYENGN